MAECGNMPDWHPYNPQQAGRTSAPTGAQSASAGHMFVPGMSPPALDGMNLSTESRHQSTKHQGDPTSFSSRSYQPGGPIVPPNCPTSSSLTPGVHMTPLSSCVSHYGATTTRNAMMESLSSSMDPRMGPVSGITEEVAHRNSQMPFPGPTSHPSSSGMNVNAGSSIHAPTMATQNSPVGSMSPGRQGAGFGACKAPCCNPDASIPYQHWDKFAAHYHGAPGAPAYRENIRQNAYPLDNRRFLPEMNLRKDCMDGKELEGPAPFPLDHRRNYPDYKYRKDSVLPRNYPNNGGNLIPNYPMQNYNFPNEYQKCPYTVKDYMRRGGAAATMNPKSSGILKYQEQQNAMAQQKYQHSKQMQYQNGSVMPNALQSGAANGTMNSPLQNSYYNAAQMPRDYSRDYQQQEQQSAAGGRIAQPANSHVHGYQKYHQVYHQKIAMQRYSVENHLRAFSRIPGYQSHPKYQECFMRYREILKLQQTVDYQNVLQEAPKIPSPSNPAAVAPINLQFDQNGMLINSNYIGAGYSPGIHGQMNPVAGAETADPSGNARMAGPTNLEAANQFVDHNESSMNLTRDLETQLRQNAAPTMHDNPERYFMPGEKNPHARYENDAGRRNETLGAIGGDETTKGGEQRAATSSGVQQSNETTTPGSLEYKNSKDFADKPELDVRQFLANWDESEDEENAATSMPDVGLSDSAAEQFEEAVFSTKTGENCSPVNSSEKDPKENKEDSPVSTSPEGQTENPASTAITEDAVNTGEREGMVKEIQCIRTDDGSDDIPTIHIVDSLESGSEIEKIHTVFGSLASAVLNPISIADGGAEAVAEGETIVLFEQKAVEFSVSSEATNSEVVEGVIASIIDSSTSESAAVADSTKRSDYKSPKGPENPNNDQLLERTTGIESSRSSGSSYTTTNSVASSSGSSKSNSEETTSLPKQNSFTSDESHNPDDISLPDLQTSECTPISTTLNTPIHSDSEESSEHVSDLTISTNPIEIIQNSPIISFTHSPIKIEPYEQLNDARLDRQSRRKEHDALDFDFDREVARRENEKYNETTDASEASVVDALEAGDRGDGDSMLLEDIREPTESYKEKNSGGDESSEFYRTADPLVGMAHISKSKDQQEDVEAAAEASGAERIDSQGDGTAEGILADDQLDGDKCPTILEREDDFDRSEDLEKLCDMSLDGSCMIPLIPGEEDCSDEPRMPVPPMEGNCLTKILTDTLPITDLDVLESSEEDKPEDDMWVEVRYMDKHLEGNSAEKTTGEARKARKSGKRQEKTKQEKTSPMAAKHQAEKIEEASREAKTSFEAVEERISSPRAKRDQQENCQKDRTLESPTSAGNEQREEEPKKSRDFGKRRISREEKQEDFGNEKPTEKDAKNTITTSILTKHRDSNVEIQVANLNLKIHDKEVVRNEAAAGKTKSQESSGDSVDGIEIKINLSRDVLSRRTSKFLEEDRRALQELQEAREPSPQPRDVAVCASGKKCCRRRRRSMPDGFESAKRTRKNEDDRCQPLHYTAKKIKARSRRKVRKSMDDELLMSQERQRKETLAEDRNFHLEMAKTFNLPWPREKTPEIGDSGSSNVAKEEETRKDKKSTSTKSRNDQRLEKHPKDPRPVSPAYNSSMDNSSTLDFDNFDVAPHNSSDTDPELSVRDDSNDGKYGKARARLEDRERYRNPTNYGSSFDELASFDAFEINLNTVPIYTTKDGRITYSPNRNYTYRALIMEARQREGYPPLRKLHYPRHLAKSHHREINPRKVYKKRYEDERAEKKRRGVEYHSVKAKRTTTARIHPEETEARGSRLKKYEGRRKETRIAADLEFCSDDDSRGYSGDVAASKSRSSDVPGAAFKPEALKVLPDLEMPTRRTEISRIDDPVEAAKHSNVMKNAEPMTSPRHFGSREAEDSIVAKIFQGQEFEISARKVVENCEVRLQGGRENCPRNSRFFQDSRLLMKTPMASPLVNLEKRPAGWDIEQDFQTVLSDSGLESSTTYVEASKESRRIQRWQQNSFVDKVPSRPIFSNIRDGGYEAVDLSHEKTREKASRYFDDEPKSLRIREEEKVEVLLETVTGKIGGSDDPFDADVKEKSSVVEEERTEKIDVEKPKIVLTTPKISLDTENALEPSEMSEIVKSLDLAVTNCNPGISKDTRGKLRREKVANIEEARGAPVFSLTSKVTEVPLRRASSDDVDSRETRSLFFQHSRLPEIEETRTTETQERPELPQEEEARIVEETENQDTRMTSSEAVDRPATPETFEAPCKDFLIDTSTSFSSCLKLRVPDPISDMPTESEASQLEEDTSTRFASVSMDFKDLPEASSSQGNFSFSNREIRNSSGIDDGRDSFLSNITESAMTASDESSRKAPESPGDSRTKGSSSREKDSSEKAPILSFSGQIHDSRHDDSPSKSPPCLINENSIPKLMIKKSESPKSSPPHPLEISREFGKENSSKKPIEYDREFVEENSKKFLEYDREFVEENSSKKTPEYDREFVEENSSKKTLEYDREFVEENSKKSLEYDREFVEENSSKKSLDYDQEISSHPKIPKMIIRNVRSRPPTPTAVVEENDEPGNSSKEQKLFEVEIKLEDRGENREECKVPKMKIKLEDKQLSTMILGSPKSLESGSDPAKSFPKVKIRKVRRSSTSRSPIRAEKFPLVGKLSRQSSETDMHMDFPENMDSSNASSSYKFTLIEKSSAKSHNTSGRVERLEEDTKQDRIPKLTIKKNTEVAGSGYSSSSSTKKRRSRSPGDSSSRKRKGTSKHSGSKKDEARSQERRTNSLDNEGTTDSQSPSEKIPKVIIKRTSPSAEFKCELSKVGREAITKDSKWQPEVKLQRSWVLDCMAKEPGSGKFALKMLEHSLDSSDCGQRSSRKNREWKRSVSDCDLDKAVVKTGNNRRRSLDESSVYDRRIRDKETAGNYEYSVKPRKLSCSANRAEKEETNDRRKSESESETPKNSCSIEAKKLNIAVKSSESENAKNSISNETAKSEENSSREKLDSNETPKKNQAATKEKSGNDEDNDGSVIKLDSSDESQTTIEILPASPDNSQPELDAMDPAVHVAENDVSCGPMGKLYSDDAIPTQFELELEIVDNSTVDSLDVPMPSYGSLEDDSTSTVENLHRLERFKPYSVTADDESHATDLGCEKFVYSDESIDPPLKKPTRDVETNARMISSSDSLVKEVLAAKETLKRCLTKSKNAAKAKAKPRTMTAAEKKQGSGFHFVGLSEFAKTSKNEQVFHGDGKSGGSLEPGVDRTPRMRIKDESAALISLEKQERYGKPWSNERRPKEESATCCASGKSSKRPAASATDVGGSRSGGKSAENENYGENSRAKSSEAAGRSEKIAKHRSAGKSTEKCGDQQQPQGGVKVEESSSKMKSYKIPKISRSREKSGKEETAKEDKRKTPSPTVMPVLEPQVELDFEIAGSDRDTSRSPPVITKQEEHDIRNELPKKLEDNVNSDKLDSITIQDPEAVTFADIVSQLAYHEKATIRHRRYCTLCERWFPTAARHRRHLTGYQHRHTELTQRRTVHALFMLFTGKPCPRLLPASIVRTDCLPGEPTPLQIAVQDVAVSLEDGAQVKPKEVSEKDD